MAAADRLLARLKDSLAAGNVLATRISPKSQPRRRESRSGDRPVSQQFCQLAKGSALPARSSADWIVPITLGTRVAF
jgi:hypothetical protein